MVEHNRVKWAVFNAVDEVNLLLPDDRKLRKSLDAVLEGERSEVDSLGRINLIVAVEQKIEEEFEVLISLSGERTWSEENSPFKTVGTLVDYVGFLLKEKNADKK